MRKFLFFIISILGFSGNLFATEFPFTDIGSSSEYYSSVKYLFDNRVISDDWSHLFRANEPMNRDAFVGLSVSVSCKKCITPSSEDIIKYQTSPFFDLEKNNPYFYCIAYASEKNIVQWYTLDTTGKTSCQDWKSYMSSPFCENNKTTRIEAVWMLLRQAHLWDDTKNTTFKKSIEISDVSSYWYGYAEKWIQAGIISLKNENKILPDENISRWEFAMMASKILSYNQCSVTDINNQMQSQILLVDADRKEIEKSTIPTWSNYQIIPQIEELSSNILGNNKDGWNYSWKLTDPATGETKTGSWENYPLWGLSCGQWIAELSVKDKSTGNTTSTSSSTFYIECKNPPNPIKNNLSVSIHANPLNAYIGKSIDFSSYVSENDGKMDYKWDFWDSTNSNVKWPVKHNYDSAGIYTVSLTVIDSNWNIAQSKIAVSISGDRDGDGDGIFDNDDLCPNVFGERENSGCPFIMITPYGTIIREKLWEKISNSGINSIKKDTDNDGILDDGDANGNNKDLCPNIAWPIENHGCPVVWILSDLWKNLCLADKAKTTGIIIGEPICTICPCDNRISILTPARSCDVLFPTILSLDQKTVFSRGPLYQVQ